MRVIQSLLVVSLAILGCNAYVSLPKVNKLDSYLIQSLRTNENVNVLVSMTAGTKDVLQQLSLRGFSGRTERVQALYDALTARATQSQSAVLAWLDQNKGQQVTVTSFWITNQIAISGANSDLIHSLESMDAISKIEEEEIIHLTDPDQSLIQEDPAPLAQWGIDKIQAPQAWALPGGNDGTGIVVANIDTGARWSHVLLRDNYLNDGHSWYDPYAKSAVAHDRHGHGTHTIGTVAGSNGYGVAPGAKWMACKGLDDSGSGASTSLIACGQFFICPTDPAGNNADCSKAPHVVCNSWGGTGGRTLYDDMFAAWHVAGIIPVFSNGNNGPSCGSAGGPGDRNVIGVGATTSTDALASFSAKGPSLFNTQKPDISAPGQSVSSASHESDTEYSVKSGTSMSCPHVTGVVALILAKNPALSYAQVKAVMENTADRNLAHTGASCGGIPDSTYPNHHFGAGRVNALKCLQSLM